MLLTAFGKPRGAVLKIGRFRPGGIIADDREVHGTIFAQLEAATRQRNRKIAEMLYYAGLVERWGSGTLEMSRSCLNAGLPEPAFSEEQRAIWVSFPSSKALKKVGDRVGEKVGDRVGEKVGENLSPKACLIVLKFNV